MALDIGTIFRTKNAPPPAASTPASGAGQPNPALSGMPDTAPNPAADLEAGVAKDAAAGGTRDKKNANPLDNFTDFFKITEDDKKNIPPDPFGEPLLSFDAKKFGESANKMNFAAGIPQEQITKALGGDAPTFTAILNRVAQASFTASAQIFSGILEQSVKKNNGRWDQALSSRFRDLQISSSRPTNPALQHPAAQPLLDALKATISGKNSNLRPDEVSAKAEEYFSTLAEAIAASKTPDKDAAKPPQEEDWTKFLGV